MQRHGSFRVRTRYKLQKGYKDKGKIKLSQFFQVLNEGDSVVLKAEPAYQKGMYYPRFHGKNGIVMGKSGDCYKVLIKDSNKDKMLIVHPVHLKKVE